MYLFVVFVDQSNVRLLFVLSLFTTRTIVRRVFIDQFTVFVVFINQPSVCPLFIDQL
jgi:hypothetical protein